MRRIVILSLVGLVLAGLFPCFGQQAGNPSPFLNSGFQQGAYSTAGVQFGIMPATFLCRVTRVTSTTIFYVEVLKNWGGNFGANGATDAWVPGYSIKGMQCYTAGNDLAVKAVTAFEYTTGKVTSAAWGTALTVGDLLMFGPTTSIYEADSLSYIQKLLWGAAGFPALTGARFVAAGGISLGEGLIYVTDKVQDIDTTVNTIESNVGLVKAIVDSLRGQKVFTVTTKAALHATSGSVNIFNGSGQWRIDYIAGRVVTALGATGNQVVYLQATSPFTKTNIALTTATGSDPWGTIYTIQTDTLLAMTKQTVHAPYYVNVKSPTGVLFGGAYLVTPDSLWTIRDSCQTTAGAGRIDWTIRATPLTAGATLTAGTGL